MSCTETNNNTTATTTTTTTSVPPKSAEVEIEVNQETQKLFIAQENIPAVCEESKHPNHLLWNRSNSRLSYLRVVAALLILAIVLITAITAICTGDLSKLSSVAVSLHNVAQTLALHYNGTA